MKIFLERRREGGGSEKGEKGEKASNSFFFILFSVKNGQASII